MSEGSGGDDIRLNLDDTVVGEPVFNISEAKIGLAKMVLLALFVLVVLTYIFSLIPDVYVTERSKKFAENLYQGIVPIVSMVIGYYFAKD